MEKVSDVDKEVQPQQHRERRGSTSDGEIQESSAIETNPEELFDKEFDSSSSNSDREMQVLEKQVVSDQEDDDYPPLHLPTTDEESALLSPSALPASDLFKPQPRRKKRKSDSKLQSGSSKIGEDSSVQSFSTAATTTSTSTQKYFSGSTSFPTTKSFLESSSQSGAIPTCRPTTLSVSTTKFSNSTSRFRSSKSIVPKRRRVGPRKPLTASDKKVSEMAPGGTGRGKPICTPLLSSFPSICPQEQDHERTPYDDNFDDDSKGCSTKTSYSGLVSKKQDLGKRMQRWKNRSTFIYAKHKFRNSGNGENRDASRDRFMCKVCKVGFTALSSLKRHYGTIYHKQQEQSGRNTLDFSDSHGQKKEPSVSTETNVLKDVTDVSNLVFQFQDSEHIVNVVPSITSAEGEGAELPSITIEIPRDNIDFGVGKMEEQSENKSEDAEVNAPVDSNKEQEADKKTAIKAARKSPDAGMSMIATSLNLLQNADTSASTTSITGTSNSLPLIGCGCMNDILQKPLESPLVCQDCGKAFEHRKSLEKHVRCYSQSEDFHCTLCPKTFKLKHHVTRHMKSFHNIDTTSSASSGAKEPLTDLDFPSSPSGSNSDGFLPYSSTVDKTLGSTSFEGQLFPATTTAASTSLSKQSVSSLSDRKRSPKKLRKRLESSPAVPNTHANPPSTFTSSIKKKKASSVTSEPGGVAATTTPSTIQNILAFTSPVCIDGMNVFKCLICNWIYPTEEQLVSHMWDHKKKSSLQYKCTEPDCLAEFKFKHDLNTHQQQIHNNSSTTIGLSERNQIVCVECPVGKSKSFQSQKELMRHMRETHNMGRKRSISSSSSSLEKKAEGNEGGGEVDDLDIRKKMQKNRCPFCPLVFIRKNVIQHMNRSHKEWQPCHHCGLALENVEQLKQHLSNDHEIDENNFDDDNEDEDDCPPPYLFPF